MADFDDASRYANARGMSHERRGSGMAPRAVATAEQWREIAIAVGRLMATAQKAEDASGDRDVRRIREGAAAVYMLAVERARDDG